MTASEGDLDAEAQLDKASLLADIIFLKGDLLKQKSNDFKNDIFQRIKDSLLGQYIDEAIADAEVKCDEELPKDWIAKALAIVEDSKNLACEDNAETKRLGCESLQKRVKSLSQ